MVRDGIFEWDEAKAEANLVKHGVSFETVNRFDWDAALTIEHKRGGETRYLSYAPVAARLHALVWTERRGRLRVISLRRANAREVMRYVKETA